MSLGAVGRAPSAGAAAAAPRELLRQRLRHDEPELAPYVRRLLDVEGERGRAAIRAIVLYGSCLSPITRKTGAFFDFFVIVDGFSDFHRRLGPRLVGPWLPPSVFFDVSHGEAGSPPLRCKYNVVSRAQLLRETGPAAHDIHLLGRFSKRLGIIYGRDAACFDEVVDCSLSAMRTLLPRSLARLGDRFTLEELLLAQLGISYDGEHRVREASKVRALLEAEREHYEALYRLLLAERPECVALGDDRYAQQPGPLARRLARSSTELFLWKSRVRGLCRWPKYVTTVDNWLDIVLDKVERHNGIRLQLTPLERRYPLIFGWGKVFRLLRQGVIR